MFAMITRIPHAIFKRRALIPKQPNTLSAETHCMRHNGEPLGSHQTNEWARAWSRHASMLNGFADGGFDWS